MENFWSEIAGQLAVPIAGVLVTLISVCFARLNSWLQKKDGNESLIAIADLVSSKVNQLNESIVADIKEAAADGKLTREEAKMIRARAAQEVREVLPKTATKAAKKLVGDLDSYIEGKIEESVDDTKSVKNQGK